MRKTYRIEVFEEPYMNDSEFLTYNGKPFTFHEIKDAKYLMGELCNAYKEDYNQEVGDDLYRVYRNDEDDNILYYISETDVEPFANNHGRRVSPKLKKYAYIMDVRRLNACKTRAPRRKNATRKSCVKSLENAYKRML